MFGKRWTAAEGTVVDSRTTHTTIDGAVSNHEFVVDVRTPDGDTFRARVGEPRIATHFMAPRIGQVVRVEYDPKSRDVRFDKDDPALRRLSNRPSRASDFDDVLRQAPGTPVAQSTDMRHANPQVQAFLDRAQQSYAPDPNSPEAAAIRDAMARAMGGQAGYPGYPNYPGYPGAPDPRSWLRAVLIGSDERLAAEAMAFPTG